MRVLILSMNYAPEATGFARHASRLSEYLVANGDKVTVVTAFPFAPRWRRWPEYKGEWVRQEQIGGVEVTRVSHFIPKTPSSKFQRMVMEASFCATATLQILRHWKHFDLVLYVGAQPAVAMLSRMLSALFRISYVVWINDLAAEAARDVGIVRSSVLLRILRWFEYAAYRKAAGAIVLCDAFRRALVREGFSDDRIRVIGSPINVNHIRPAARTNDLRRRLGAPENAFLVLYAGSMGLKQGMANVVEAAAIVHRANPTIHWILIGEGEEREATAKRIASAALGEVMQLLPLQPEETLPQMFAIADVLLLNQLSTVKDTVVPSKLLTYMAAGKPVVAAVNSTSEAAALLAQSRGGMLVRPEDPAALAAAIVALTDSERKPELVSMSLLNRAYAVEHFDEKRVFAEQRRFLHSIVHPRKKNLRLLFINHNVVRSGGTFFRAFDVARFLVRRGHAVTLLTISRRARWRTSREIVEGVEIVHTPDLFWGIGRSGWDPWDTLVRVKLAARRRWDLIHAWDSRPAVILPALMGRFFSRRNRAKLVIDWSDWWGRGGTQMERGGGWTRYLYNAVETLFEERFRRFADGTTVISRALRDRAIGLRISSDKVRLLPQGCDRVVNGSRLSSEEARNELEIFHDGPLFITIGVLNVSDAKLLFETIRLVHDRLPSARFKLIGINRVKAPSDLTGSIVEEVGYVPDEVLSQYVAAADALIVPLADNVSSKARWPSRVNVALSRGLHPVVVTRVGDLPQLLEREGAAYVAEPCPADFAEKMLQAISGGEAAERVCAAGQRVAAELLPWEGIVAGLEDFYYEVTQDADATASGP